jgi:hypothetical protein
MHPQSTDGLGARVALLQSPIPPNRANKHTEPARRDHPKKGMGVTFFIQNNDQANSPVLPLNQIE